MWGRGGGGGGANLHLQNKHLRRVGGGGGQTSVPVIGSVVWGLGGGKCPSCILNLGKRGQMSFSTFFSFGEGRQMSWAWKDKCPGIKLTKW